MGAVWSRSSSKPPPPVNHITLSSENSKSLDNSLIHKARPVTLERIINGLVYFVTYIIRTIFLEILDSVRKSVSAMLYSFRQGLGVLANGLGSPMPFGVPSCCRRNECAAPPQSAVYFL